MSIMIILFPFWAQMLNVKWQGCGSRSACIFPPGSGSRMEKFSNKIRKNSRKFVIIASLFKFAKYICTNFFVSYFWAIFMCFFQLKKTLHKVFFLQTCLSWIRILKAAGSGSALRKLLDRDPQKWTQIHSPGKITSQDEALFSMMQF